MIRQKVKNSITEGCKMLFHGHFRGRKGINTRYDMDFYLAWEALILNFQEVMEILTGF